MRTWVKVVLFICAVGLIALFVDRAILTVKDVRVVCDAEVNSDEIIRASGVNMGGRLFSVDKAALARGINSLGTHKCLSVELEYPSTVVIAVEPRTPAAFSYSGGNAVIMDIEGCAMYSQAHVPDYQCTYVTGLDIASYSIGACVNARADRIAAMCEVVSAINKCQAGEYVSELNVGDVRGLYIYSRTGIYVSLGDSENMLAKTALMKYTLIDLENRGSTSGKLDVSSGDTADYRPD